MGMTEEVRRNIFEPFFTTKAQGKGTGLGLSMVDGIVKQSGGFIEVDSEPGRGTTFRIYLPSVEDAPSPSGKPAAVPAMRGNETILVVEDQAEVREYAAVALGAYGYRVIEAASAEEALLRCERERGCINLVLTDVVMPNISGRELADRLEKLHPEMKVLFMSGYAADIVGLHGMSEQGAVLIEKPFLPEQLATKIREVLGEAGADEATVLVAEDSPPVRKILSEILHDAGYRVVEARDGVEALEKLPEGHVRLALMDASLTRLGGLDAAREMRKQRPAVKIILMSAALDGAGALDPAAVGVDGVLQKPMEPAALLEMVRRVLASDSHD
jgi:CheY-like chemotaxis protein